jgi:hypothetical protein
MAGIKMDRFEIALHLIAKYPENKDESISLQAIPKISGIAGDIISNKDITNIERKFYSESVSKLDKDIFKAITTLLNYSIKHNIKNINISWNESKAQFAQEYLRINTTQKSDMLN